MNFHLFENYFEEKSLEKEILSKPHKFEIKKDFPDEGIVKIEYPEELEFLYQIFRSKGYIDGYNNYDYKVLNWIKNWKKKYESSKRAAPQDDIYFQWVPRNSRREDSVNQFFCIPLTRQEILNSLDTVTLLDFDDFAKLKDHYKVIKTGRKFGI